jgi:hypothetical protein
MKRREFITLLAVRLWHGRLRHGGNAGDAGGWLSSQRLARNAARSGRRISVRLEGERW